MRRLIRGSLARMLASVLVALFAGPALMGWVLALPGVAQITPQVELELVAVVPFQNLSKVQPEALGEKATAAVHQALLDTQFYDVRPLEETRQKMADLALRAPLDERAFDRLGEAMGVGGIVFGEIRSAGIRRLTRSAQGEVVLMVAIYDVPSRSLRAGTIVTAHSSPAVGEIDADKLVEEALNQAAYQAVKEIQSHRPITGLVQWAREKDVVLNVGQTQGVRETMKFVVLREGQRVGIIEITRSERAYSDARLLEGHARTGDRVREVFSIPARGAVVELPAVKKEKKRGMSKLLLALAAGLLMFGLTKGSGGKSATENVTAAAVSNVVLTGLNVIPTETGIDEEVPGGGGAIQVRWGSPRRAEDIIHAYEIWRNGQLHWVELGQAAAGRIFIDPRPRQGLEMTIEIDPLTGTGRTPDPTSLEIPSFAEDEVIVLPIATFSLNSAVAPTSITYTLPGDWVQKDFTVGEETVTVLMYAGPPPGTHHTYQVRKVTSQRLGAITADQAYEIVRETLPGRPVIATFVGPPPLVQPANGDIVSDPTAVIFGFYTVPGADDYILQVSLDSQFAAGATVNDNLTNLDGILNPAMLQLITKDLVSMLGSLPSGTAVFWRVGARWRGDTTMPLPYPMIGKAPSDPFRYVFSSARMLYAP